MRASLGFRAGPLYVGTGNLAKTRRRPPRRPSGGEVLVWLVCAPVVIVWVVLVLCWRLGVVCWQGGVRRAQHRRQQRTASGPQDDPAWRP